MTGYSLSLDEEQKMDTTHFSKKDNSVKYVCQKVKIKTDFVLISKYIQIYIEKKIMKLYSFTWKYMSIIPLIILV